MSYIAKKEFNLDAEVILEGTPSHKKTETQYHPHFLDMVVSVSDTGSVRFEYKSENIHKAFSFSSKPEITGAPEIENWLNKIYNEHNL